MMRKQQGEGAETHTVGFEDEDEEVADNNSIKNLLNAITATNWGISSMNAQDGHKELILQNWMKMKKCYSWHMLSCTMLPEKRYDF